MLEARDSLSYADITDAIRRGLGTLEYADPEAGMVYRLMEGLAYIAVFSDDAASFLPHLPEKGLAVVHGDRTARFMMENMGFEGVEATYLYVYRGSRPAGTSADIRTLDASYLRFVTERYDTSSESDIMNAIVNGHLYGAFSPSGDIMGFTGFHSEGSMGMLTVLPEYRRRGVGEALEKHLLRTAIDEGRTPFCNVYLSNSASIALQEKLGLERGDVLSWWIWKE